MKNPPYVADKSVGSQQFCTKWYTNHEKVGKDELVGDFLDVSHGSQVDRSVTLTFADVPDFDLTFASTRGGGGRNMMYQVFVDRHASCEEEEEEIVVTPAPCIPDQDDDDDEPDDDEPDVTPEVKPSTWWCVARVNRGQVQGPYTNFQDAKNVLNEQEGKQTNRQMICEMTNAGAKRDPHKVNGQNQGGGTGAGFNKWWWNWEDIGRMNKMCNDNSICRTQEVKPSTWWCVARVNRGQVQGPYTNFQDAKNVLNEQEGKQTNRQMICEMTNAGAKGDPHKVNGQNQGGGTGAGFNKWWWNWEDIGRM